MIVHYWSNSKFAAWLRKISGQPVQPPWATWEGWEQFRKDSEAAAPLTYEFIESLDKAQRLIHWLPSKMNSFIYYLHNVKNSSHVLRTTVKRGSYSDLANKIPDALMLAVIDFVEEECFWHDLCWHQEKPDYCTEYTWKYVNSPKWKRMFMVKPTDIQRQIHGFKYMDYQIENGMHDEPHPYIEIKEAYMFAKYKYFDFDEYEESGFNSLPDIGRTMKLTNEQKELLNKSREIGKDFDQELIKHCTAIIKHHQSLWT